MGILVIAVLIGLIPATIAHNKGRGFAGWWFYGTALFIIALPHALLLGEALFTSKIIKIAHSSWRRDI